MAEVDGNIIALIGLALAGFGLLWKRLADPDSSVGETSNRDSDSAETPAYLERRHDPTDVAEQASDSTTHEPSRFAPLFTMTPFIIGLAAFGTGVLLWQHPTVIPIPVRTGLQELASAPETPFLILGGAVGGLAFLLVTFGSRPTTQRLLSDVTPPEPVRTPHSERVGTDVDQYFDSLDDVSGSVDTSTRADVVDQLRELTAECLVTYRGEAPERARRLVDRGEWTDNAAVAGFLASDAGPEIPLWTRFRDWISAEATIRRRVRRTLAEIETLRGESAQ